MNLRYLAVDCLYRVLHSGCRANAAILDAFHSANPSAADRRLLHEIVYGVLRRHYSLEADVSRFTSRKPDDWVRLALLVGTYQLRHMRVPDHAAVSETVNAVKASKFGRASGMVNAVLRKIIAKPPPAKLKPHQRSELPQWLYRGWRDAYGAEAVERFCACAQRPPLLTLAMLHADRDDWIGRACAQGLDARAGELSPQAVMMPAGTNPVELPGFDKGDFIVMDQSAQLAALALKNASGRLLDMCAAPGGKAIVLHATTSGTQVTAVELSAARLPILRENLERTNAMDIRLVQADAACLPAGAESFDAVLLDAPCSASGILRRHPDAKFLHSPEDIARHTVLQARLLREAVRVVGPGGRIVYAVCSIHAAENEEAIAPLLSDKSLVADTLSPILQSFECGPGMARLLPSEDHDGFFIACLKKV